MDKAIKNQIRNIIVVLSSAIICAGFLAVYMITYYGPSGQYIAGNTILSPYIIDKVNFSDKKVKGTVKFVYKGTEFIYLNNENKPVRKEVSYKDYEDFYHLVASEKSLDPSEQDMEQFFSTPHLATLLVSMQTDANAFQATSVFQTIQFSDKDYFRVQLENQGRNEWIYFFRQGLYADIMKLFTHDTL